MYICACRLHSVSAIEDSGFACLAVACSLLSPGDGWRACFCSWLLSSGPVVDWLLSLLLFDISPGQALSSPFVLLMMELISKDC